MKSNLREISIRNIFLVFASMGNLTFGGGNATVAVLHREIISRLSWITNEQFVLSFAISRLSPGSNYFAFCVSIGWLLKNLPGAITSLLASSIPCSLIAAIATALFSFAQSNSIIKSSIHGAIAAAVSITLFTCWTLVKPYLTKNSTFRVLSIMSLTFILHYALELSAIDIIIISAFLGSFFPENQK
jgi:chromate transporter